MKIGTFFKNSYLQLLILLFSLIFLKEEVKKNIEGTLSTIMLMMTISDPRLFLSGLSEGSGFGCVLCFSCVC